MLSEVGSKDASVNIAPYLWVQWMREELDAGAWKVIAEGREGGTAGIYRPTGELRTGLVDEIEHSLDFHDLIWEAPTKASQAWFVKHFGPEVNLGNIPPEEVIPLETLRLGLAAVRDLRPAAVKTACAPPATIPHIGSLRPPAGGRATHDRAPASRRGARPGSAAPPVPSPPTDTQRARRRAPEGRRSRRGRDRRIRSPEDRD